MMSTSYKTQIFILVMTLILGCESYRSDSSPTLSQSHDSRMDTVPRVTGIGGIFFKSKNPSEIKNWYADNLGLAVDEFGAPFEFRNAHRPNEINYLNWDAFADSTTYFHPSEKEFIINYRVQNIKGLVKKLKRNGIIPLNEVATYEYGKFVHIIGS